MEQQAILALGTLTLGCCGVGLVFIHSSNPLLKGLNWMGAALVAGAAGTAFLLASSMLPALRPIANCCILLAFTLCFRADQYLVDHAAKMPLLGKLMLGIQIGVAPLQWLHLTGDRFSDVVLSVLMAIQLDATSRLIHRSPSDGKTLPSRFTAGFMRFLSGAALFRGVCAAAGVLAIPRWGSIAETFTYSLFIAAAISLGFCFFWRATTKMTVELEQMASTDPLTRVFNRRVFLKWCDQELLRTLQSGVPFSTLLVDFDYFKQINDTFGHLVGDAVLCAAVERIQDSIRGVDVLCRWGGEEFAVLLPNASKEATALVAERIRQNVQLLSGPCARSVMSIPEEVRLTVSIGASTYSGVGDSIVAMLQRADKALYGAKRSGRNRVVLASEEPLQPTSADVSEAHSAVSEPAAAYSLG